MRNKVAGITGSTKLSWEMDTSEVRRVMEINFMGTFLNCVEAIPGMIEQGWGAYHKHFIDCQKRR